MTALPYWARATSRSKPVPDLDLANPRDAYRRPSEEVLRRIDEYGDRETELAAQMDQLLKDDLARLSRHTETMSPWDAAYAALKPEER